MVAFCDRKVERIIEGGENVNEKTSLVRVEMIEESIHIIRGQKVILDQDLAKLYEVETKVLMQAVRRNFERFPQDFMFQLTLEEAQVSRSQIVTLKRGQNIKYLPHAFTEQGVAMLSSVLRSKRAIQVNIEIMRAFVHLKQIAYSHAEFAHKLDALEKKYDAQFRIVFDAIRQLMAPPKPKKGQVGFHWQAKEQPKAPSGKPGKPGKPPGRKKVPSGAGSGV